MCDLHSKLHWLLHLIYILMYPNDATFFFSFSFFCLAAHPSTICFLLQEDEPSGLPSALWFCANSAASQSCSLSRLHLLFDSKGTGALYLEHSFGSNHLNGLWIPTEGMNPHGGNGSPLWE